MTDPIDTFEIPSELSALLSVEDQKNVRATILDIDLRFLKEDPEIEAWRRRGEHLWLLFDAIAAPLQNLSGFKEELVPNFVPRMIEQIRRDMSWYPHNVLDLRDFYLVAPIRKWRHAAQLQGDNRPETVRTVDPADPAIPSSEPPAVKPGLAANLKEALRWRPCGTSQLSVRT